MNPASRCLTGKGGTCLWPVKQKQRATVKALGIVQRNTGRRVTAGELTFLAHSEVWHEFLYRVIRGQTIALPWAMVDVGPVNGPELEQMIEIGLAPYHAERPEVPDDEPQPARPPDNDRARRIKSAKAARRKHRGGFLGV